MRQNVDHQHDHHRERDDAFNPGVNLLQDAAQKVAAPDVVELPREPPDRPTVCVQKRQTTHDRHQSQGGDERRYPKTHDHETAEQAARCADQHADDHRQNDAGVNRDELHFQHAGQENAAQCDQRPYGKIDARRQNHVRHPGGNDGVDGNLPENVDLILVRQVAVRENGENDDLEGERKVDSVAFEQNPWRER